MGCSQRLRLSDARAIFRLVREACELGDDADEWKQHAMRRLFELTGATAGTAYVLRIPIVPGNMSFAHTAHAGALRDWNLPDFDRGGGIAANPTNAGMMRTIHLRRTHLRRQLCSETQWYSSGFFNEFQKRLGLDDAIMSVYPLPSLGLASGLSLCRGLGDHPFEPRQQKMLDLFHEELAELWESAPLALSDHPPLYPRLAQTLALLAEGLSEKQVAQRLGISRHTVHNYTKELHRRFGAASSAELLAKARPRPTFRPSLLPALVGSVSAAFQQHNRPMLDRSAPATDLGSER